MNYPQSLVGDCIPQGSLAPTLELSRLWPRLVAGELKISAHGERGNECWLSLRRIAPAWRVPLALDVAHISEQVLSGRPQKCLAIELGVSASTVSGHVTQGLQALGAVGSGSRAPLGLALAAACHQQRRLGALAKWPARVSECAAIVDVSIARPEVSLNPWLSAVEREIAELSLTGVCHQEISRRRGRSVRTIANQLHSIYDKLGVSGRFQLVHLAVVLANSSESSPSSERLKRCAAHVRAHGPRLDGVQVPHGTREPRLAASG